MNRKLRLLFLAALLTGVGLLGAAQRAVACVPDMCWIVDEYTVCCWDESCNLWCG